MDYHGITMKGNYFMEEVSGPSANTSYQKRIIYNVSATINGASDYYGQYKMFYHNNSKWIRPLCGNVNDGPDADNTRNLGTASYRFANIYSVNFRATNIYGAVRYS